MVDRPFRATVMFAIMSCDEFPHASTVNPIIVLGIRHKIPKKLSKFTSLSAIRSSHVAEATNPIRVIGTFCTRHVRREVP